MDYYSSVHICVCIYIISNEGGSFDNHSQNSHVAYSLCVACSINDSFCLFRYLFFLHLFYFHSFIRSYYLLYIYIYIPFISIIWVRLTHFLDHQMKPEKINKFFTLTNQTNFLPLLNCMLYKINESERVRR